MGGDAEKRIAQAGRYNHEGQVENTGMRLAFGRQ